MSEYPLASTSDSNLIPLSSRLIRDTHCVCPSIKGEGEPTQTETRDNSPSRPRGASSPRASLDEPGAPTRPAITRSQTTPGNDTLPPYRNRYANLTGTLSQTPGASQATLLPNVNRSTSAGALASMCSGTHSYADITRSPSPSSILLDAGKAYGSQQPDPTRGPMTGRRIADARTDPTEATDSQSSRESIATILRKVWNDFTPSFQQADDVTNTLAPSTSDHLLRTQGTISLLRHRRGDINSKELLSCTTMINTLQIEDSNPQDPTPPAPTDRGNRTEPQWTDRGNLSRRSSQRDDRDSLSRQPTRRGDRSSLSQRSSQRDDSSQGSRYRSPSMSTIRSQASTTQQNTNAPLQQDVMMYQLNCYRKSDVNAEFIDLVQSPGHDRYMLFLQEPALTPRSKGKRYRTPCSLPVTRNKFHAVPQPDGPSIRACLIADDFETLDLMPEYTDTDIVTVMWTVTDRRPYRTTRPKRTTTSQRSHPIHDISSDSDDDDIDDDDTLLSDDEEAIATPISQIVVCSYYWDIHLQSPQGDPILPPKLIAILKHCETHSLPIILCGDTNAHSEAWGHPSENPRGRILEDLIIDYGLTIHNNSAFPTWERRDTCSCIDVTLTGGEISNHLTNWRINPVGSVSDHKRIEFRIFTTPPPRPQIRNLRKCNWDIYKGAVAAAIFGKFVPDEWTIDTIEGSVAFLYDIIEKGLDAACPKKDRKVARKKRYVSGAFRQVRKTCNKLLRTKGRAPWTDEAYDAYRTARRQRRALFRQCQRRQWQEFTSEPTHPLGAAQIMRVIRSNQAIPPTLLCDNGHYTATKADTIQVLMNTHFPGSLEAHDIRDIDFDNASSTQLPTLDWINPWRVRNAIDTFKNFKAGGTDDI